MASLAESPWLGKSRSHAVSRAACTASIPIAGGAMNRIRSDSAAPTVTFLPFAVWAYPQRAGEGHKAASRADRGAARERSSRQAESRLIDFGGGIP